MNTEQIKLKLQSEEYDFLRTIPGLGDNIILLTTGGSHAYGTNIETSDLDIRGITLNTKDEILSMTAREKPYENKATDTSIYTVRQIFTLLKNCNPNVIEITGTKDEHKFVLKEEGKMIIDNIDLFLSKRAANSFLGYSIQQLRRLQNALARDSYPQEEKEEHIAKSIKKQMEHLMRHYTSFTHENINIYVDDTDKEGFVKEIFVDFNLKRYPLRDFFNVQQEMTNVIRDYEKIGKRNHKKDEEHLFKHAMHLIRLFLMGSEILEGKGINTYREHDKEFLLSIRNGKYTYKEIFEMADQYEKRFKYAMENTTLPDQPDENKINELLMEINEKVINRK